MSKLLASLLALSLAGLPGARAAERVSVRTTTPARTPAAPLPAAGVQAPLLDKHPLNPVLGVQPETPAAAQPQLEQPAVKSEAAQTAVSGSPAARPAQAFPAAREARAARTREAPTGRPAAGRIASAGIDFDGTGLPRGGEETTLRELLNGDAPIGSMLDWATGNGAWLRAARRQKWLPEDARVAGVELRKPVPYGDSVVDPREDWRGLKIYTPDSAALLDAGKVDLIHEAFMHPSTALSYAHLNRIDALLREGGWLLLSHSNWILRGGVQQAHFIRWLRRKGYSYRVFRPATGIPKDYPKSFWWKWFESSYPGTNYLIVARKEGLPAEKFSASSALEAGARILRFAINTLINPPALLALPLGIVFVFYLALDALLRILFLRPGERTARDRRLST